MKESLSIIKIDSNKATRSKQGYLEKNSPEWFAWRRQGLTSNDVMILLNLLTHKTRRQLWEEKTGAIPMEAEPEEALEQKESEPALEADLEGIESLGQIWGKGPLLRTCVESVGYPMMRAVLDGLQDNGEPIEIKEPSREMMRAVIEQKEDSPAYRFYYPQVQHQLLVTGANQGILAFHYYSTWQSFKVVRDDALIQSMLTEIQRFWQQVVSGLYT